LHSSLQLQASFFAADLGQDAHVQFPGAHLHSPSQLQASSFFVDFLGQEAQEHLPGAQEQPSLQLNISTRSSLASPVLLTCSQSIWSTLDKNRTCRLQERTCTRPRSCKRPPSSPTWGTMHTCKRRACICTRPRSCRRIPASLSISGMKRSCRLPGRTCTRPRSCRRIPASCSPWDTKYRCTRREHRSSLLHS